MSAANLFHLRGVYVPLLTPFQSDGELDPPALERLVDYVLAAGVHGLFLGGTTGEFPLLSTAERQRVAEVVVARAAGRVPVVVHAGAPSTREAIQLARHAPHVAAEIVRRCPNVVGIKDSSGNLSQTIEYFTLRADFQVAQGADGLLVAGLAMGVEAAVSGNANVFPELAVAVFEAWWRGDQAAARTAQARFDAARRPLRSGLDMSLFKGVLARRGVEVGDVRSPLRPATETEIQAAVAAIEAAGVTVRPLVAR